MNKLKTSLPENDNDKPTQYTQSKYISK